MKYKAVIGIEMHCEISRTNSKVFSSASNSFNDCPNGNVRPLDMGFPGTLPVVNKEAVRKSIMMSLMLGCKVPEYLYFERKNYLKNMMQLFYLLVVVLLNFWMILRIVRFLILNL